jgi:DNA-binding FadR family transcriptional regulator
MESMFHNSELYKTLVKLCDHCEEASDRHSFIEADLQFHRALVAASGVSPLAVFNDVIQEFFARFEEDVTIDRKGWVEGARVHKRIIDALEKGNLSAAEQCLNVHVSVYLKPTH